MADYEHTQVMSVPPDAVLDHVARPENLAQLLPAAVRAETLGARLRIDREGRRLDWEGAEVPHRGWLRIDPLPSGCDVTAHLSFPDAPAGGTPDPRDVRARLGEGLEAVRDALEGRRGDGRPSVD